MKMAEILALSSYPLGRIYQQTTTCCFLEFEHTATVDLNMANPISGKKYSSGMHFLPCLLLLLQCQLTTAFVTVAGSRSGAPVVAFAPPAPPSSRVSLSLLADVDSGQTAAAISESTLWALRFGSAITTYVGALALLDRSQGQLLVDPTQQIVIQDSTVPGAGLGLFAKTDLAKGTVLGTYPGAVLPLQQNLNKLKEYPPCEGYIWRFSDNKFVIDPTNAVGVLDPVCFGGNPSMPGSLWLFKNVLGKIVNADTALCRINEPPRGGDRNVVIEENLQDRNVIFSLERDVFAGEEFFIDYGQSYDRSMYGGTPPKSDASDSDTSNLNYIDAEKIDE
jgi:hypothetical protein